MIPIFHKAKQFLVFSIKVLIVSAAFYFIYNHLATNNQLNWSKFLDLFQKKQSFFGILFIISFSILNRFFEIVKWQNLISSVQEISLWSATAQVLGALTVGIFTPNGLGEYAGKAFFYPKSETKKIIFLNLICNGVQMVLTIGFGLFGLLYFNTVYPIVSLKIIIIILIGFVALVFFAFCIKKTSFIGFSIDKVIRKINEIPKPIHQKNILLGLGRYLVFTHQYYFLLLVFDVNQSYFILIATISGVYLLSSSLPSFQFLDFAIKGSVAVYFFTILHVNEWIVAFITTLMWFFNVVLPVILGSYFVLRFKKNRKASILLKMKLFCNFSKNGF